MKIQSFIILLILSMLVFSGCVMQSWSKTVNPGDVCFVNQTGLTRCGPTANNPGYDSVYICQGSTWNFKQTCDNFNPCVQQSSTLATCFPCNEWKNTGYYINECRGHYE